MISLGKIGEIMEKEYSYKYSFDEVKSSCGIYGILNKINKKIYVGKTYTNRGFFGRWNNERGCLNRNTASDPNQYVQNAWNKYGEENFEFIILEKIQLIENDKSMEEYVYEREQYWQDFYQSYNPKYGYNMRKKVDTNIGMRASEETKRRLSESWTPERKEKWSKEHSGEKHFIYGKHISEEAKEKMRIANLGRKHTEEVKRKISEMKSGVPLEKIKGEGNGRAVLKEQDVIDILNEFMLGNISTRKLSNKYSVTLGMIKHILKGRSWKHIPRNQEKINEILKTNGNVTAENSIISKLSNENAKEILRFFLIGFSIKELANKYKVTRGTIENIINRKTYKDIGLNEEPLSKLLNNRKEMNKKNINRKINNGNCL